jgi:hypothetical protein
MTELQRCDGTYHPTVHKDKRGNGFTQYCRRYTRVPFTIAEEIPEKVFDFALTPTHTDQVMVDDD